MTLKNFGPGVIRKFSSCLEERAADELMRAGNSISKLILLLTANDRALTAILGLELTKILQETVVSNHDLLVVPKNISGEVRAILIYLRSTIIGVELFQYCSGIENE